METEVINKASLARAADIIKKGGLVAVPTETVYGLAGNGLDEEAVREIYEVKGRPAVKPLSLMVSGIDAIDSYCESAPDSARALAERFWPGPLTIVMNAKAFIPQIVLAGGTTVGLRCPDHPLTLRLLELSGLPFAAPSANPSGSESPKTAEKVMEYFSGRIAAVVDGGTCGIGTESTIIDMSKTPYKLLRQGALPAEEIEDALVDAMKLIGITGGTGCGKTTALNVLGSMGALIIDCDSLYHELLQSGGELVSELAERFPTAMKDGALDRKALGAIVFSDASALRELNAITHRHIWLEIRRQLREYAMSGGTLAAIDAIELLSGELAAHCLATVGILASQDRRVERIMDRDGISREYAMMRVKAQRPDSYFEDNCSYILHNDGDSEQFKNECRKLFKEILIDG